MNNNNAKTPSSLIISCFSFILPLNSQLLCKVTGCCMKTALYALTQAPSIYSVENDDTNNSNACLVFGRCHSHMTRYSKSKQQEWHDVLKEKAGYFFSSHANKTVNFQASANLSAIQRNFTLSQICQLTCLVTNQSWKVDSCEYRNNCGRVGGEEVTSKGICMTGTLWTGPWGVQVPFSKTHPDELLGRNTSNPRKSLQLHLVGFETCYIDWIYVNFVQWDVSAALKCIFRCFSNLLGHSQSQHLTDNTNLHQEQICNISAKN